MTFVATKKGMTTIFFHPESGMGKKSGSGINIPDPQHCKVEEKKPVGVQEGGATVHYLELVMRSDNASGAAAIVKRPQVRSCLVFSWLFIV